MNQYGQIFQALNTANIRYIVVGGVAMNLLGYPRFTGDLDILLALDEDNIHTMKKVMHDMQYIERLPISITELGDEQKVMHLIQEKNLIAFTFWNPHQPEFSVDIIVGDSLKFDDYVVNIQTMSLWNIPIPVIAIDDLIAMKELAHREKDISDVQALLELKGL